MSELKKLPTVVLEPKAALVRHAETLNQLIDRQPISITAAELADINHFVNAIGPKYEGRMLRTSDTHRIYVARGGGPGDLWDLCDGSASVTPV